MESDDTSQFISASAACEVVGALHKGKPVLVIWWPDRLRSRIRYHFSQNPQAPRTCPAPATAPQLLRSQLPGESSRVSSANRSKGPRWASTFFISLRSFDISIIVPPSWPLPTPPYQRHPARSRCQLPDIELRVPTLPPKPDHFRVKQILACSHRSGSPGTALQRP